jgi:hypothetical protein
LSKLFNSWKLKFLYGIQTIINKIQHFRKRQKIKSKVILAICIEIASEITKKIHFILPTILYEILSNFLLFHHFNLIIHQGLSFNIFPMVLYNSVLLNFSYYLSTNNSH